MGYADIHGATRGQITAQSWTVFPVELLSQKGGRTILSERRDLEPVRRMARPEMLEKFLVLADGDDGVILEFAREYGLLGLCRHGEPSSRDVAVATSYMVATYRRGPGNCSQARGRLPGPTSRLGEFTDHWRAFARRLGCCLDVGEELRRGRVLSAESATAAFGGLYHSNADLKIAEKIDDMIEKVFAPGIPRTHQQRLSVQCRFFCDFLNRWLSVQATATYAGRPPRLELEYGPSSLVGTLVLQTTLSATGRTQLVICHNCARPFWAKKRRSSGQRAYCDQYQCRTLAAQRDAARDYRSRLQSNSTARTSGKKPRGRRGLAKK